MKLSSLISLLLVLAMLVGFGVAAVVVDILWGVPAGAVAMFVPEAISEVE